MIKIPTIEDPRGNLAFIQSGPGGACPFEIGSVAWDGRPGEMRVEVPCSTAIVTLSPDRDPRAIPPAQGLYVDAHATSRVDECRIIRLPARAVVNGAADIPFDVQRVFYVYGVPPGAERGGHSHHQDQQLIIAPVGQFDVVVEDGLNPPCRYTLDRPDRALYVPAGIWRTLDTFSPGAVCLVLTAYPFSEADYVRDYDDYLSLTRDRKW